MMAGRVLLQLWSGHRERLLSELKFYRDQGKKRVLSQFADIEGEAEEFSNHAFQTMGRFADPERYDPSDFAEAAIEKGVDHFMLLQNLHKQMLLGLIAGMYHEFDKQLREWLHAEFSHSFHMEKLGPKIWNLDIGKIFDLLESLGWNVRTQSFFTTIDSCRLIVNVFKHGNGKSLDDLKGTYPEFIKGIFPGENLPRFLDLTDHTNLNVSAGDLDRFYQAFRQFWKRVPKEIRSSDSIMVPDWFAKAVE